MSDKTDSHFFSSFFRPGQPNEVVSGKIPICAKYSDFYNLSHGQRGVALIFNHETFDNKKNVSREGTNNDRDRLKEVLTSLEFEVRVYNDMTYGEIYSTIKKVAQEDHSNSDCLLVCVMSHGEEGKIIAKDYGYPPDILWEPFTGDNSPTLVGKPKMFFIQACRGNMVDDGVKMRSRLQTDSTPAVNEIYTIPAMADIIVMYSSYNGYYSWRSPTRGSWFIQSLCEELEENGERTNLLTLLTSVNRRVSISYKSCVPGEANMHEKKQVCTIVSMLTRLMAFPKKSKYIDQLETINVLQQDGNKTENGEETK